MSRFAHSKSVLALACWIMLGGTALAQERGREANSDNPFLPAGAEDRGWPGVRGPNFDGQSREVRIADAWPDAGPPVLWTQELGQGYSAFVANGTCVYTQGQTLGGQYVYCIDADAILDFRF